MMPFVFANISYLCGAMLQFTYCGTCIRKKNMNLQSLQFGGVMVRNITPPFLYVVCMYVVCMCVHD